MGNDSLRVLGLQVSLLELNRFGILLGEREEGQVSIVMGGIFSIEARDMDTKILSALELNNTLARYWFRRNIPVTTFWSWHDNWGGSISPEGFLSSVLLWLVIILAVVSVGVTVVVVIIVAVVVVVVESSFVVKLSFVIT
ncbi:hypothetical protein Tco_0010049 [Tanacetum coccineum]